MPFQSSNTELLFIQNDVLNDGFEYRESTCNILFIGSDVLFTRLRFYDPLSE